MIEGTLADGRTADLERDFRYENLAGDAAALPDHLNIPSAELIGYRMGGGNARQRAIRHPDKVRKVEGSENRTGNPGREHVSPKVQIPPTVAFATTSGI